MKGAFENKKITQENITILINGCVKQKGNKYGDTRYLACPANSKTDVKLSDTKIINSIKTR